MIRRGVSGLVEDRAHGQERCGNAGFTWRRRRPRVGGGLEFATAHESVQRTGIKEEKTLSAMDRYNNSVGYGYAKKWARKKNNTFLCNGMRNKAKTARYKTRGKASGQLYFLRKLDNHKPDRRLVRQLDRRCQNAPNPR